MPRKTLRGSKGKDLARVEVILYQAHEVFVVALDRALLGGCARAPTACHAIVHFQHAESRVGRAHVGRRTHSAREGIVHASTLMGLHVFIVFITHRIYYEFHTT